MMKVGKTLVVVLGHHRRRRTRSELDSTSDVGHRGVVLHPGPKHWRNKQAFTTRIPPRIRVRYRAIFRRDTISRYPSQKNWIWIRYLDISHLVISDDTGYDLTICRDIYHAMSHRMTSKHQVNANSTKTHNLVAVYSSFFWLCLCPHLGLSAVCPFFAVLLLFIRWTHHRTGR